MNISEFLDWAMVAISIGVAAMIWGIILIGTVYFWRHRDD